MELNGDYFLAFFAFGETTTTTTTTRVLFIHLFLKFNHKLKTTVVSSAFSLCFEVLFDAAASISLKKALPQNDSLKQ